MAIGVRVAVVTPYFKESLEVLEQCHRSVMEQSVPADHFLVADGAARQEIDSWTANHVILPKDCDDWGNTPRTVGCLLADSGGYDFIALLDADNWYYPNHIETLVKLWEERKTPVCASFRSFHALDGALLPVSEPQEDRLEHVDASCLLIHRSAFGLNTLWARIPKEISPLSDRIYLAAVRWNRFPISHSKQRTVAFRSQYENHYRWAGQEPPEACKTFANVKPCYEYLRTIRGISECVDRLGFYPLPHMAIG